MSKGKAKTETEWVPKLSAVIRADQYHDLQEYIPWGMRAHIFQRIVDDLLVVLKSKSREKFLAAFFPPVGSERKIHLEDFNRETADAVKEK